jgi:type I site-specific restriction endonuclease
MPRQISEERTRKKMIDPQLIKAGQVHFGKTRTTMGLIDVFMRSNQARLALLRELQSETQKELDALLPSVLDRAHKGEL